MTEILSITNQKGGVGKTTTSVNLASSLAVLKKKVLLIDMDPQGNATMGSGVQKNELLHGIDDVLLGEVLLAQAIVRTEVGYDLVGANRNLSGVELSIVGTAEREFILKRALAESLARYDYVLIDCAPSLNLLTINALCASTGVIIPMQCEYYALEGVADLVSTIDVLKSRLNPLLRIEGVLRTLFDGRSTLTNDVSNELVTYFGQQMFNTIIPRNIRLAEAPAHGRPVMFFEKNSRGALAYHELASELILRQKKRVKLASSTSNSL